MKTLEDIIILGTALVGFLGFVALVLCGVSTLLDLAKKNH
jgi:uncharacterized protein YciW